MEPGVYVYRMKFFPSILFKFEYNIFFPIFLKFYFIFKLYIIVLVLPNIKMNPPQVYMYTCEYDFCRENERRY